MARRLGRSRWAQETVGFLLATYLSLVRRTNRFTTVPADVDAFIEGEMPLIAAMWHGQHLMTPFARPETMVRLAVLISRHEDAGAQALAAERLGITAGARLGRPRGSRLLQRRRAGHARAHARSSKRASPSP